MRVSWLPWRWTWQIFGNCLCSLPERLHSVVIQRLPQEMIIALQKAQLSETQPVGACFCRFLIVCFFGWLRSCSPFPQGLRSCASYRCQPLRIYSRSSVTGQGASALSCASTGLMVLQVLLSIVFAAAVSWCLLNVMIPGLRLHLLDQPNARSSHHHPIPRGGGVSFVLVSCVASVLAWVNSASSASVSLPLVVSPLLALPLALVGFWDDCHRVPATWRFGAQIVLALVVILFSPLVSFFFGLLSLLVLLVIAISVAAVINFTNFMDGLDGLVAGCMAVAMTSAAIQLSAPLPIWVLVGALLGFLLWNWSPAKVFMGDVGSTFLGAVFAVLVLQSRTWPEAFGLLLVATPLLGDACLCVLRRLMHGQRVFQAHRLHLYQRLHQGGWPHARVSSHYIAATAVLAFALIWGGLHWVITLAALQLLLGFWLDQKVAVPFAVASRH